MGPLLFILYVNDIPSCVPISQTFMYADDAKLTKEVNCFGDCLDLQQGLSGICDWSQSQKHVFNVAKCNLLHFHASVCDINYNYSIDGVSLPVLDSHKDMELLFLRIYLGENITVQ